MRGRARPPTFQCRSRAPRRRRACSCANRRRRPSCREALRLVRGRSRGRCPAGDRGRGNRLLRRARGCCRRAFRPACARRDPGCLGPSPWSACCGRPWRRPIASARACVRQAAGLRTPAGSSPRAPGAGRCRAAPCHPPLRGSRGYPTTCRRACAPSCRSARELFADRPWGGLSLLHSSMPLSGYRGSCDLARVITTSARSGSVASTGVAGVERSQVSCRFASCRVAAIPISRNSPASMSPARYCHACR